MNTFYWIGGLGALALLLYLLVALFRAEDF
ncbi:MAG: K(+)-transporting ATPase subunit F [Betaproteobacteria bacterium]|nr:K(+)-transporting ATPase subunit F [Betaproteobacteria bacterium]MDE2123072.1 K(+)-transporting ATPase subunit F [Betaproteobacteria bacterium]MDE2186016.1 K(+)-transporting ATPase subunit F [Betaproteobacteria bacterium]MDE2325649.1 K(+)-transporting ATPase subunit F [Betaproteobacteria bacterium]